MFFPLVIEVDRRQSRPTQWWWQSKGRNPDAMQRELAQLRRQGELEVLDQVEQDGLHLDHASVRVRIRGICAG